MKILFQGDSVTDAGRTSVNSENLGRGYPLFVAGELQSRYPDKGFQVVNRGISGNRVVDLYQRWKVDCLNHRPDVISILIGINDVWHELGDRNGVDNEKYYRTYCEILEEVLRMCPGVKIFILEPFVLKAAATEGAWNVFDRETRMRAASAKKAAARYGCVFVPLQEKFDAVCTEAAPASYWLHDGVHPTAMGHELIARELTAAFCAAQ